MCVSEHGGDLWSLEHTLGMNGFTRIAVAICGVPVEIIYRIAGAKWHLDKTVRYEHESGWSLTAWEGMPYDSFTCAPNLRNKDGSKSRAAALHDRGWATGKKDDGSILTFDENNVAFRHVLDTENHPEIVKDAYERGVSLGFMRKRWEEKHGHE
jgi:hypothetical protein